MYICVLFLKYYGYEEIINAKNLPDFAFFNGKNEKKHGFSNFCKKTENHTSY